MLISVRFLIQIYIQQYEQHLWVQSLRPQWTSSCIIYNSNKFKTFKRRVSSKTEVFIRREEIYSDRGGSRMSVALWSSTKNESQPWRSKTQYKGEAQRYIHPQVFLNIVACICILFFLI